jgi:hypothetical protein
VPTTDREAAPARGPALQRALRAAGFGPLTLASRVSLDPSFVTEIEERLSALAGRQISIEMRIDPRLASGVKRLNKRLAPGKLTPIPAPATPSALGGVTGTT